MRNIGHLTDLPGSEALDIGLQPTNPFDDDNEVARQPTPANARPPAPRRPRTPRLAEDSLPLRPECPFIMPDPNTVTLIGFQFKYSVAGVHFISMKSAFTEELPVYPATTFPTFVHVIKQRLMLRRSPSQVESGRAVAVTMRIDFVYRESNGHGVEKDMAATAEHWELIQEILRDGRGRNFSVDYAMSDGSRAG